VIESFKNSRSNYGSRRIKIDIYKKKGLVVSRRKIRRIMKQNYLFSSYQEAQFKVCHKSKNYNREKVENIVDRQFNGRPFKEVLISDLTYITVSNRTAYICLITDLFNREIVGYSVGFNKTPQLVLEAFNKIKNLSEVKYFHTDRGTEFKNSEIDNLLKGYGISRSLSHPGTPYDNACAESLYDTLKIEFVKNQNFLSLKILDSQLLDYIYWYNYSRLHSSLGYCSPIEYKTKKFLETGKINVQTEFGLKNC